MEKLLGKADLPALAIEIVAIVFSVLLALGVDQYMESRNERTVSARVTETIRTEISDNRTLIRDALAHHDSLIAGTESGRLVRRAGTIPLADWRSRGNNRMALRELVVESLADSGTIVSPGFTLHKSRLGEYQVVDMDMAAPIRIDHDTVIVFMPRGVQLRSALIRNTAWEIAQATGALVRMPVSLVAAMADLYQLQHNYQSAANDVLQSLYHGTFTLSSMQDLQYWETTLLKRYAAIDSLLPSQSK